MSSLLTYLVLVSVVAMVASLGGHPHPMLFGRPSRGGFLRMKDDEMVSNDDLTKSTIDQLVDHFDPYNNATYKQRYWRKSDYYKGNGIVFLLIQGEGIATDAWASMGNLTYQKLAALYGADIYQLEHRCFGFSRPYPDLAYQHLHVCNVANAMEDIHNFIQTMNTQQGYKNPRWVTFGGSYPGYLSALFRANYPQDTVGAVASSAPIWWTLDYFQYAQVVNNVIYDVSKACGDAISQSFKIMQQKSLNSAGRADLNKYFNIVPALNDSSTQLDIDNFFANLFGYYQDVTQYTYDGRNAATRGGLDVTNLCNIMTNANVTDPIQRVVNVIQWYNTLNGVSDNGVFDNSYSDMITSLANTTYDDEDPYQDQAAGRGWMWLCCNEMGVLQTTDQGRNIFQQIVPLNFYIDMCTQGFDANINIYTIRDNNIAFYNKYGGIDGFKATNVVLPNGGYDPWHVLGITNVNDPVNHVTSILIPKAGHCSDMYAQYPGEAAGLKDARNTINKEVAYFLGEAVQPFPQ